MSNTFLQGGKNFLGESSPPCAPPVTGLCTVMLKMIPSNDLAITVSVNREKETVILIFSFLQNAESWRRRSVTKLSLIWWALHHHFTKKIQTFLILAREWTFARSRTCTGVVILSHKHWFFRYGRDRVVSRRLSLNNAEMAKWWTRAALMWIRGEYLMSCVFWGIDTGYHEISCKYN